MWNPEIGPRKVRKRCGGSPDGGGELYYNLARCSLELSRPYILNFLRDDAINKGNRTRGSRTNHLAGLCFLCVQTGCFGEAASWQRVFHPSIEPF